MVERDTKTNSHIDSSDWKSNIMFDLARGGIELDFRSQTVPKLSLKKLEK